ncbi:hypothetical protein KP13_03127 (plasmid) [Klebsiella pneumoniae subsp. pneumoniae Kp13]|nr:hypothetical protein KP13_03127 [Klebsiella pneumoniae subsp. pneumoniae Kp13]
MSLVHVYIAAKKQKSEIAHERSSTFCSSGKKDEGYAGTAKFFDVCRKISHKINRV